MPCPVNDALGARTVTLVLLIAAIAASAAAGQAANSAPGVVTDSSSDATIDDDDTDMVVNSQPLQFAFAFPYGVQTLGVSSRLVLRKNEGNWAKHRVLLSLYNADLYLKPRYFLSRNNLRFLMERRHGLVRQAQMRFAHMREGF